MNIDPTKPVRLARPDAETALLTLDYVLTEVVRILDEERSPTQDDMRHAEAA
ncbi:MAG: hypothetical protein HY059_02525 [Proteobacteria bacterium]|nr:hypothetical protein [Pseudomonadota bacterium]